MEQYGYNGQAPNGQMSDGQMQGGQMPPQEMDDGTKVLGILSIVFAFLMPLVGLILAIVGTSKAKRILKEKGHPAEGAGFLQAGLICSIVIMALWLIMIVFMIVAFFAVLNVAENTYWDDMDDYVNSGKCDSASCIEVIVGDWDCYDGTSSITGYQYDEDGNIIGHDGSKQNPEVTRRYEFGTSLVYAYDVNNEADNNLRGSYMYRLYEAETSGKFEYELTVKFSEFMSGGVSADEYIGESATWNVIVDPDDEDMMGIGMGDGVYECRRAD